MDALTFGSCFSGIGGFEFGFEAIGWKCKWQIENNEFCRAVLRKHNKTVPLFGDIKRVGVKDLTRVDVMCGGFPCQDVSGTYGLGNENKKGINGKRSGLWSEFVRLLRGLKPKFAVIESVVGLLHRGLDKVLHDLDKSGYDAEWQTLPASAFGAFHDRQRVVILAYLHGQCGERSVLEAGEDGGSQLQRTRFHSLVVATRGKRPGTRLEREPDVGRMVHGVPYQFHRLFALGNTVYPPMIAWVGKKIQQEVDSWTS